MTSTPSSVTTPSSPPTSSKNSTIDKPATSPSRQPTRRFSMSLTPPLHPSKNSRPLPRSEYASPQQGWGITPRFPLGQLRPSSAWRTTPSPTPRGPSLTASSQPSNAEAWSPTNASQNPDDASTSSRERYMHGRPKSDTFGITTLPLTCQPGTNGME